MSHFNPRQPVRIPQDPCSWGDGIYIGKEVEFTPVGAQQSARAVVAQRFMTRLAARIPHTPRGPGTECDLFTPLGRFYVEMSEFIEVAGPTCQSAEAVPWALEKAFQCLRQVTIDIRGRSIALCHTPSDYGNYTSAMEGPAHSTGCHVNLLCPRPLDATELQAFAALVSPLNAVFGPGGLTWSGDTPQLSCDPRADHVQLLVGAAAHGRAPKPFIMKRDEPFAQTPNQRLQITAFGSPRSPVSSWLQAELLTQAFAAILGRKSPPWRVADPIRTARARPQDPIALYRSWRHGIRLVDKAELAIKTIRWLARRAAPRCARRVAAQRIAMVRDLSVAAITAIGQNRSTPPLFPTDIVVKQYLFDRVAQMHQFEDFADLASNCDRRSSNAKAKAALDAIVVTDVLFSTPNDQRSTYELANRCGLFVRPEFEYPIDPADFAQLPPGVAPRDTTRARLIAKPQSARERVCCCDWNRLVTRDGVKIESPNPWSEWEATAAADQLPV